VALCIEDNMTDCPETCSGGNPCAANPNRPHAMHTCTDAACRCHQRYDTATCLEKLAFDRFVDRYGHLPETATVLALATAWRELRTRLIAAGWPERCITVDVLAAYVPAWSERVDKPKRGAE
jgi:hypothetical protein